MSKRKLSVNLHDTTIGIWQGDAQDPSFRAEVFGPLIRMLRNAGWKIGSDPQIVKHYNCLRHDHRLMSKGQLLGKLNISGRHIEIEIWAETWAKVNPSGHRYDFDKRQRLEYLDRLRVELLERKIIAWLGKRAEVAVKRPNRRHMPAMDQIAKSYAESWHRDEALGRPACHGDYNATAADGAIIQHGQIVWVKAEKGRILRGRAFYNLNNMWWVVLAKDRLTNKACFEIYTSPPEDLRRKRNESTRRERLEGELAAAVRASDFRRAELLNKIIFAGEPVWRIWSRKHDCYYRPQYSGYTSDANSAGRYTRAEAEREVRRVPHILHAIGPDGRREDFAQAVRAA